MEYDSNNISPINCVVCGNEIHSFQLGDSTKIKESSWRGGVVGSVSASYGSTLDGDVYYIGICDECIIEKTLAGIMIFDKNYMQPHLTGEIRNNLNLTTHRKIKLKRLLNKEKI